MDPTSEKASYKESICHWVWLRFAGKSALGQLRGRPRARGLSASARKDLQRPDWTHNGDAVELGRHGAANLQLEGRGLRGAALPPGPGPRRGVLRAPRAPLRPSTAPDPPLPPGFRSPRARGRTPHRAPLPPLAVGTWGVEKPGRKTSTGQGWLSQAAREPTERANFPRKTLQQVRRKH